MVRSEARWGCMTLERLQGSRSQKSLKFPLKSFLGLLSEEEPWQDFEQRVARIFLPFQRDHSGCGVENTFYLLLYPVLGYSLVSNVLRVSIINFTSGLKMC